MQMAFAVLFLELFLIFLNIMQHRFEVVWRFVKWLPELWHERLLPLLQRRSQSFVEQGFEHPCTAQRAFVKIEIMAFEVRLLRQRQMSLEGTQEFLELFEVLWQIKMIPRKMKLDTAAGNVRIPIHQDHPDHRAH